MVGIRLESFSHSLLSCFVFYSFHPYRNPNSNPFSRLLLISTLLHINQCFISILILIVEKLTPAFDPFPPYTPSSPSLILLSHTCPLRSTYAPSVPGQTIAPSTYVPTYSPSFAPSATPSTMSPSFVPTPIPSYAPTYNPNFISSAPSHLPTPTPTVAPTLAPLSKQPTAQVSPLLSSLLPLLKDVKEIFHVSLCLFLWNLSSHIPKTWGGP